MVLVDKKIYLEELKNIAKEQFGNLVKVVVDIEKEIMVIGGELHSDEEIFLLDRGSEQKNLWGINIYPDLEEREWIEFDSLINLRPSQGNLSRSVDDPKIREKIVKVINKLIKR